MKPFVNIELIKALAPLVGWIVLVIFGVVYRKQIGGILSALLKLVEKVSSVKALGAEVAITQSTTTQELVAAQPETKAIEAGAATNLPMIESEPPKASIEAETEKDRLKTIIVAIASKEFKRAEEIFLQVQGAEADGVEKIRNEAVYLWVLYMEGDTSSLEKLHNLTQKPGAPPDVAYYIAVCYEHARSYDKAATWFMQCVEKEAAPITQANNLVHASQCLYKAGKHQEAFNAILTRLSKFDAESALSLLYKGLAELYDLDGEKRLRIIAFEKAVENNPNDTDLLFSAGFALSEQNYDELSLLHYDTLLTFDRTNSTALNNIGVQYKELGMPIKSVEAYRRATEEKNALAASNLAYLYMRAGFADEAMKVLDEVKQQEDLPENVGSALAAVLAMKRKEAEKRSKVIDSAVEQQVFLCDFADAYFLPLSSQPSLTGTWKASDGRQIEISVQHNKVQGGWTEEGNITVVHTFSGEISNRGIVIKEYKASSTNSYYPTRYAEFGYAYISKDGEQINVLSYKTDGHIKTTLIRHSEQTLHQITA